MSAAAQEIQVRRRLPRFGQVPDALLEDRSMSLEARAVLAYLVGRSDGFKVAVGCLCYVLGIKDARWRRLRKEMEAARYFQQTRVRRDDGTFVWVNEVFDTPFDPPTIPPKPTDGKPTRGKAIHGKPTDLPYGVHHTENPIERREARAPRASADAQRAPASAAGFHGVEDGPEPQKPKTASKGTASPPFRPVGRYRESAEGIWHEPGNELDTENLTRIAKHGQAAIALAVTAAAAQDSRGRAFASAVIKHLEPRSGKPARAGAEEPAWATSGLDSGLNSEQVDAATSTCIEGYFEEIDYAPT